MLIVEDDETARESYAAALRFKGYQVDTAFDYEAASRQLLERTYHAAIVDIYLGGPDDFTNEDGRRVLELIRTLSEGTVGIVISGTAETQLAGDVFQLHGAMHFLSKKALREQGLRALEQVVRKAIAACKLRLLGSYSDLISLLAGNADVNIWSHRCLALVEPSQGFPVFSQFLNAFMAPLLPVLPLLGESSPMKEIEPLLLHGTFWSKSLAEPVTIFIGRAQDVISKIVRGSSLIDSNARELAHYVEHGLEGIAFSLSSKKRADFVFKI